MSEFTGMALYSQSDIKVALTNYKIGLDRAKVLLAKLIKEAEYNWQPSWLDKLWQVKTLHDKFVDSSSYTNYLRYLEIRGYIEFNDEAWEIIGTYYERSLLYTGLSEWAAESHQITNLYGSGRDCYLTPTQAKFVNKFKDMEVL